jgi:transketolase
MSAVLASATHTMREQAAATVVDRFYEDPRVAVVLADISVDHFRPALRHDPRRAVNVGIMEQTMVGVAAGFALEGFRPVVHTIAPFLTERALEQVKLDLGYQRLGALLIGVGGSYDYAESGVTHHGPGDVQAVSTVPGLEVLVPGSAGETDALVRAALDSGRLTYLRTSVAENASDHPVAPGGLAVLRRGRGPTVVAVGPMLERTLAAVSGLDATVLYATTVVPLDAGVLARMASELVVTVEPFYEGTLAAQVAAALSHRPTRIVSIGVPRAVHDRYGTYREHDAALGLDVRGLRERFLALAG